MAKSGIDYQPSVVQIRDSSLRLQGFVPSFKATQDELKDFVMGIGKVLNDIIEADLFPSANSLEARRRNQELFEFMLAVAWQEEFFLEYIFSTYIQSLIERAAEIELSLNVEFAKNMQQLLYSFLQFVEIQKMEFIRELIRLQAEVLRIQFELQQAYLNLSAAILTAFDQLLVELTNQVITIPELGNLTIHSHDMIRYIGDELARRVAHGDIRASELDETIEEAELKFITHAFPGFRNKSTEIQNSLLSRFDNVIAHVKKYLFSKNEIQNTQAAAIKLDAKLINKNQELRDKENMLASLSVSVKKVANNPAAVVTTSPMKEKAFLSTRLFSVFSAPPNRDLKIIAAPAAASPSGSNTTNSDNIIDEIKEIAATAKKHTF